MFPFPGVLLFYCCVFVLVVSISFAAVIVEMVTTVTSSLGLMALSLF